MDRSIQNTRAVHNETMRNEPSDRGVSFPVRYEARRGILDTARHYDTVALDVDHDGLRTTAPRGDLSDVRYVWLEFDLPVDPSEGDGEVAHIRALGELDEPRGAVQRVRFKHLFPDQRVRLERFLRRREALTRAA